MASVASASPIGQAFTCTDSTEDTDSWQYIETPSPAGLLPSPANSSFSGWGVVGFTNQLGNSPTASPLHSDYDHQVGRPPTSFPAQLNTSAPTGDEVEAQLFSLMNTQEFEMNRDLFFSDLTSDVSEQGRLVLSDGAELSPSYQATFPEDGVVDHLDLGNLQPADLDIPLQFREDDNTSPWALMNLQDDDLTSFTLYDPANYVPASPSRSSHGHDSEKSSPVLLSPKHKTTKDPDSIRKVIGGRVGKTAVDNFVVLTPDSINQKSGKPNPFDCFEAIRSTHRGRTGPLANNVAKSALNIRRMGACFCCRSRKVKCDEERPCKNCKKILAQVPQIVCWQFSDFLPVLFPDFIRGHFKKEAMSRFITDNISAFHDSSALLGPCAIEMSSGARFHSTLTVLATTFTPKDAGILQHWHMGGVNQLELQSRGALAIGVDPKNANSRETLKRRAREYVQNLVDEPRYAEQVTDSLRGTHLPRRILTIIQRFAQRSQSSMVKRALGIYVTHYVLTKQLCFTPATISRLHEQPSHIQIPDHPSGSATSRILNRQVKAVLDEYLLRETQSLFTAFGTCLKPRSRTEWAPCLASFLVLCLLMESIEAAADIFMVSEAEIALRRRRRRSVSISGVDEKGTFTVEGRRQALEVCRQIDNLPFRQVAYRFHAVYQTHHVREPGVGNNTTVSSNPSSSASGNGLVNGAGAAFNPLIDAELDADLDPAAAEMAMSLRALLDNDWYELDFLVADPILSQEAHPYPRDTTLDYTGRLLARFLLSFTDEKYLFDI
ncbi:hypothetical protein GGR57DRAFT_446439 [Xylariaceae sp. FL1272]|nr:hypothetical protein GGR57DRAFT_446439 [Xylariaceae sp. FL1272]